MSENWLVVETAPTKGLKPSCGDWVLACEGRLRVFVAANLFAGHEFSDTFLDKTLGAYLNLASRARIIASARLETCNLLKTFET